MKVLQVLGGLNRGGLEVWLMQMVPIFCARGIETDFAVYDDRIFDFAETVENYGGRIFPVGRPNAPVSYVRNIKKVIEQYGPYDVVHSQLAETSTLALLGAKLAGVRGTIAHSTNDNMAGLSYRGAVNALLRPGISIVSSRQLAGSRNAGRAVFSARSEWDVVHCGIDLKAVENSREDVPADLREIRGSADLVLGHIARFAPPKNQKFSIDVFRELNRYVPKSRLVFVGSGPQLDDCRVYARAMGLEDRVLFLGTRTDSIALMSHAFDALIMPSFSEGLPIVMLEAQAVGVPMVVATTITPEATIFEDSITSLSLANSTESWANAVVNIVASNPRSQRTSRVAEMKNTTFDVTVSAEAMIEIYQGLVDRERGPE